MEFEVKCHIKGKVFFVNCYAQGVYEAKEYVYRIYPDANVLTVNRKW